MTFPNPPLDDIYGSRNCENKIDFGIANKLTNNFTEQRSYNLSAVAEAPCSLKSLHVNHSFSQLNF